MVFLAMLLIVVNVTMRYFHYALPAFLEFSQLCLVFIFFSGLAYCQIKGVHIQIRLILDKLSPKVRSSVEILILILAFGLIVVFTWQTGIYAWASYLEKEFSFGLIEYPTWVPKILTPLGLFLFGLAILIEVMERAIRLVRRQSWRQN
ncbi:hypothetical protein ES703_77603 [subsurface metagenome]